jgi:arabinose-5-phosphate isomerase
MIINNLQIKESAIQTLKSEAGAIENLIGFVNDEFTESIRLIFGSAGRVIVTGVGKSAIICEKIVATFNSTGTPAIFMHAADAVHGDLGIVQKDDIIICLSKSGNTPEIKVLIPYLKLSGNKLIALVGDPGSYLARQADFVIRTTVAKEACPNNLAPTSSTTAQLAMGDAMAVALLKLRGFTPDDFAMYHPGGVLGKKLFLRVADLYVNNEKPAVESNASLTEVIIEITSRRLGATAVLKNNKLIGIITDCDLRRMLLSGKSGDAITAEEIMTKNPKTVTSDMLLAHALDLMRSNNITQLPVVNKDKYMGVIHLHDILKEGIL